MAITKWINLRHPTLEDRLEHAAMIREYVRELSEGTKQPPPSEMLNVPSAMFYAAAYHWHGLSEAYKDYVRETVRKELAHSMDKEGKPKPYQ